MPRYFFNILYNYLRSFRLQILNRGIKALRTISDTHNTGLVKGSTLSNGDFAGHHIPHPSIIFNKNTLNLIQVLQVVGLTIYLNPRTDSKQREKPERIIYQ